MTRKERKKKKIPFELNIDVIFEKVKWFLVLFSLQTIKHRVLIDYICVHNARARNIHFIYLFLRKRKNKMKIIAYGQNVKSLYLDEKDNLIFCIKYMMMLLDDKE